MAAVTVRRRAGGQGTIEFAMTLAPVLVMILLILSAEFALFQAQEVRDAADGAVRAASVVGRSDLAELDGTGCDARILGELRHAAVTLNVPASAHLCMPSSGGRPDRSRLTLATRDLAVCIHALPTLYTPTQVTATVAYQVNPLDAFGLFEVTATSVGATTTGPTGVPGTAAASPCSVPFG